MVAPGEERQTIDFSQLGFHIDLLNELRDLISNGDQEIIDEYLRIARGHPYNMVNWETINDAINNDDMETKSAIAEATHESLQHQYVGGKRRRSRKQRKSKKHRKSRKQRKSRKRRYIK